MKVVVATGGTGGHVLPALRLAERLTADGDEVWMCGALKPWWRRRARETGIPVKTWRVEGLLGRPPLQTLEAGVKMAVAVRRAMGWLKTVDPEVVVGFGGYAAFPATLAGVLLRYPVVLHEQNAVAGLANKALARAADRVAVGFACAKTGFPASKVVWTGCPLGFGPCGEDPKTVRRRLGLAQDGLTLLVVGGSQGSREINQLFLDTLDMFGTTAPFQVVHISGEKDYQTVKKAYNQKGISAVVFSFCDRMAEVYRACDAVIARAGALTVMEIASVGLPALLIPYPYAGAHQEANARALRAAGPARVLPPDRRTPAELKAGLAWLIARAGGECEYKGIHRPEAAERLARLLKEVCS